MNQATNEQSPEDVFDPHESLRRNVSLLGSLLGETMAEHLGDDFLARVEQIRLLSKSASGGDESSWTQLEALLLELSDTEIIPVARAFAQFLNLANIAEQHHGLSREMDRLNSSSQTLTKVI
jgi:phosphoenolpyruvate carboxylase